MPELRFNPLSGEWALIAVERASRPESFSMKENLEKAVPKNACPFCNGSETMTPPEVYALGSEGRQPNTPDWQIRVVPNKFPALNREVIPTDGYLEKGKCALVCMGYGYGAHEVIISSPAHDKSIGQIDQAQVELILQTYQKRYRVTAKDKLVKYIQMICNHGKTAGASLEHPHSQLFGLPFVPQVLQTEIGRSYEYFKQNKRTMLSAVLDDARQKNLIVFENEDFVVFEPFWARMPFETWIVPKTPEPEFSELSAEQLGRFAKAIRMMLQKLYLKLNNPPYNYYIHTYPTVEDPANDKQKAAFHWHLECIPRLSVQAGLEYGTGVFINTMQPEKAAEFLRE
jgi:UDPglucose--hexose-1-phosphate uridylyltransferase